MGADREFIKASAWAVQAVQPLKEVSLSGTSLGWYTLWVKHVHLIRANRAALSSGSSFLFDVLRRPLGELFMHVSTIGDPWWKPDLSRVQKPQKDSPPELIRDRLAAYCAWCLDGDLMLLASKLEPSNLNDVRGKLKRAGMPWAYDVYTQQSMILHQSSVMEFVGFEESRLSPIAPDEDRLEQQGLRAARFIKNSIWMLGSFAKRALGQ